MGARLVALAWLAGAGGACRAPTQEHSVAHPAPSTSAPRATAIAKAECGGCGVEAPGPLGDAQVASHLQAIAQAPYAAPSLSLETLLFHAEASRAYVRRRGTHPLDAERAAHLRRELRRQHAVVQMRLIDAQGRVRARLPRRRVALGVKEHLHFAHLDGVEPFVASGTVARVGLGHIWTRY